MRIRGIIHRTDLPGHDISQKQLAESSDPAPCRACSPGI